MPLQNRVNPIGRLHANPSRAGTLMGNRGRLHNQDQTLRTEWGSERRWIYCTTDALFGKRVPMDPSLNSYTELFFLDTPTALAAGHRPCAQCKRQEYLAFKNVWLAAGLSESRDYSVVLIDSELSKERGAGLRCRPEKLANLPPGTMVRLPGENTFFLVIPENRLLRWSFDGYTAGPEVSPDRDVEVVTPPSMVKVLAAGFLAEPHSSARDLAGA